VRPRGFKALTGLEALSDEVVQDTALGNWHKLNAVLLAESTARTVERLLALELMRGKDARANFLERLRGALWRARSTDSAKALRVLLHKPKHTTIFKHDYLQLLIELGLTERWAKRVVKELMK
jgi:uncharacterized protein YaaW (UPF0174 family)